MTTSAIPLEASHRMLKGLTLRKASTFVIRVAKVHVPIAPAKLRSGQGPISMKEVTHQRLVMQK
jgi:hypothetical protein